MTLAEFKQHNAIVFKNDDLLAQAFIHRSFINENPRSGFEHNERLEFLGDAILELVVTEYLYASYPHHNEGDLTAYRSALVNAVTLGQVADSLSFNDMMKLSKGEAKDVSRARSSILADAYEAFIGALYLDQGYEAAKGFLRTTILSKTDEVVSKNLWRDAKSFFQEKAQEYTGATPTYETIEEVGPDHAKQFTVGVFIGRERVASGAGFSKQEAEQEAALAALEKKGW